MEILIIEDELKTGRALAKMVLAAEPESRIVKIIQSVESAISFFQASPSPDLIFMDVQLADGQCFEIFSQVKVVSPVIFCTAFDEFTMEAFKVNGVDYVLKPFSADRIKAAIDKVKNLQNFFNNSAESSLDLSKLLSQFQPRAFKKSFLVFQHHKYQTIAIENVAYFFIRNEMTMIVTMEGIEYHLAQTLEEVQSQTDQQEFFRLNRQYLIAFKAIKEVEHYFGRKLSIHLKIAVDERLLVGKDKTTQFLSWLSHR